MHVKYRVDFPSSIICRPIWLVFISFYTKPLRFVCIFAYFHNAIQEADIVTFHWHHLLSIMQYMIREDIQVLELHFSKWGASRGQVARVHRDSKWLLSTPLQSVISLRVSRGAGCLTVGPSPPLATPLHPRNHCYILQFHSGSIVFQFLAHVENMLML